MDGRMDANAFVHLEGQTKAESLSFDLLLSILCPTILYSQLVAIFYDSSRMLIRSLSNFAASAIVCFPNALHSCVAKRHHISLLR